MPPTHQLLMPAVLAGSAGFIAIRNPWRRYPALFSWALLTAFFVGVTWGNQPYPKWIMIAAAVLLPLQVRESLICRRISVSWRAFGLALAGAVVFSAALGWPARSWNVARGYYQLSAMAVMICATIHRLRHPMIESRRDLAYGLGMTLWLFVKAPASTFVKGGLGTWLFPAVGRDAVEVSCYWLLMACVVGMALAMVAKGPGRKHAAKNTRGRTVTGLIELQKGRAA